jgi:hypothetical protein
MTGPGVGAMQAQEVCLFPDAATKRSEATAVRTVRTGRDPQRQRGVQASSSNRGRWLDQGGRNGDPGPGWVAIVQLPNSTRTGIVAVAGFCCFSLCRAFCFLWIERPGHVAVFGEARRTAAPMPG